MGRKDLWNFLSPLCEGKPLYELQSETVAIDLSGWIVDNVVQPKMYLSGSQDKRIAKKGGRTQFNRILKECKEMLICRSIACLQGHGEAEAMCAYLNEDGIVDICISQDSDCFLYIALVVYRNFCMNTQVNRGTTGGSIDVYNMEKIKRTWNIGWNKMIALALLYGCDYDEGVTVLERSCIKILHDFRQRKCIAKNSRVKNS